MDLTTVQNLCEPLRNLSTEDQKVIEATLLAVGRDDPLKTLVLIQLHAMSDINMNLQNYGSYLRELRTLKKKYLKFNEILFSCEFWNN
jgi:hypothetical protein